MGVLATSTRRSTPGRPGASTRSTAGSRGDADRAFLERIFHKLLLNFTWWVNRKDSDGRNVFQGGFLGLDNIGVFDRSAPLPVDGHLGQADGTAWMGMYCLNMLAIALELARENPVYEDIATKFFEHFLYIAGALNDVGVETRPAVGRRRTSSSTTSLHLATGEFIPLKVRSLVGLIPLLAVETLEPELLERMPGFRRRMRWFLANRPGPGGARRVAGRSPASGERRLLALVHGHRMKALLAPDAGRGRVPVARTGSGRSAGSTSSSRTSSTSAARGTRSTTSRPSRETGLFGGNSNWRGPVWFPINYLLIEALQKFDHYYGPEFTVECPTGSGRLASLGEVADDLATRLVSLFLRDANGHRPALARAGRPGRRPALLRVLPRRHRGGPRRQPPDRLDRAGRQAARGHGPAPSSGAGRASAGSWPVSQSGDGQGRERGAVPGPRPSRAPCSPGSLHTHTVGSLG